MTAKSKISARSHQQQHQQTHGRVSRGRGKKSVGGGGGGGEGRERNDYVPGKCVLHLLFPFSLSFSHPLPSCRCSCRALAASRAASRDQCSHTRSLTLSGCTAKCVAVSTHRLPLPPPPLHPHRSVLRAPDATSDDGGGGSAAAARLATDGACDGDADVGRRLQRSAHVCPRLRRQALPASLSAACVDHVARPHLQLCRSRYHAGSAEPRAGGERRSLAPRAK